MSETTGKPRSSGRRAVTQQEADAKAADLERGLKEDGIWDKLDNFLMVVEGEYILEMQGDHVIARFVGFDP